MNFADVEDAAAGHLLAADRGKPGERYILGGENTTWTALIDAVVEYSGIHNPILVLPTESARLARVREALGLPSAISTEGYALMAQDWRFSSAKAERALGYRARPLEETIRATVDGYLELIEAGAFEGAERSGMSAVAEGLGAVGRLGLLAPVRIGQRITGRRVLAGV